MGQEKVWFLVTISLQKDNKEEKTIIFKWAINKYIYIYTYIYIYVYIYIYIYVYTQYDAHRKSNWNLQKRMIHHGVKLDPVLMIFQRAPCSFQGSHGPRCNAPVFLVEADRLFRDLDPEADSDADQRRAAREIAWDYILYNTVMKKIYYLDFLMFMYGCTYIRGHYMLFGTVMGSI